MLYLIHSGTMGNLNNATATGYLLGLGAAVTYGTITTFGKFSTNSADPLLVTSLAYLIGGLILFTYRPSSFIERKNMPLLILTSLLGGAIAPALFIKGLAITTASDAALLGNAEVLFTALIAVIAFRERMSKKQYLAGLLVVAGILIVSTNLELAGRTFLAHFEGNVMVIAGTAVWGLDNNVSKIASIRMDPTVLSRYKNLVGGAVLLFAREFIHPVHLSGESIPYIILLGIVSVGFSTLFLMHSLRRIGAIRAVLVFSAASVFGLIFALLFLGETISVIQLVGSALIFSGLYLVQKNERVENLHS
ncbi:MAG: DMT family transporter [Conexivisphaerales archaeon]